MSRIGKRPVTVPSGVTATVEGQTVKMKGPKGQLQFVVHDDVEVKFENGAVKVAPRFETNRAQALYGTARAQVANLVAGSFWTKLAAVEPTTAITVPTVTVGSEFTTRHPSATARHVCPFKMGDELVLVELVLMGN